MSFKKLASCLVPNINLQLSFIVDGLALALNSSGLFTFIVSHLFGTLINTMFYIINIVVIRTYISIYSNRISDESPAH